MPSALQSRTISTLAISSIPASGPKSVILLGRELNSRVLSEGAIQRNQLEHSGVDGCLFRSAALKGNRIAGGNVTRSSLQRVDLRRASFSAQRSLTQIRRASAPSPKQPSERLANLAYLRVGAEPRLTASATLYLQSRSGD